MCGVVMERCKNLFAIESKKSIFFSGDGLKVYMDYERVDLERIQQKWDLRRNLYQVTLPTPKGGGFYSTHEPTCALR